MSASGLVLSDWDEPSLTRKVYARSGSHSTDAAAATGQHSLLSQSMCTVFQLDAMYHEAQLHAHCDCKLTLPFRAQVTLLLQMHDTCSLARLHLHSHLATYTVLQTDALSECQMLCTQTACTQLSPHQTS